MFFSSDYFHFFSLDYVIFVLKELLALDLPNEGKLKRLDRFFFTVQDVVEMSEAESETEDTNEIGRSQSMENVANEFDEKKNWNLARRRHRSAVSSLRISDSISLWYN